MPRLIINLPGNRSAEVNFSKKPKLFVNIGSCRKRWTVTCYLDSTDKVRYRNFPESAFKRPWIQIAFNAGTKRAIILRREFQKLTDRATSDEEPLIFDTTAI